LEITAVLHTLIQQHKTVSLPQHCFDVILVATANQKQVVCAGLQMELSFDQLGEAVYASAQVCVAALSEYSDNAAYPHDIFILIFLLKH